MGSQYNKDPNILGSILGFPILGSYLEGRGDVVSRLTAHITHTVTLIIPIINLLTRSP